MRSAVVIRSIVALAAAMLVAAVAGWLPYRPASAAAVIAALGFAGEALIALRERVAPRTARPKAPRREALVDTSALIDGRLTDVVQSGFLDLELVVPGFVLVELQHIADATDPMRRARGRRGLDVLQALRNAAGEPVRVIDDAADDEAAVDLKLVAVARRRGAALVTTDFNLNKVAGIRDVVVLNINDLAHALRPVVLPGETLRATIIKEGKEPGQGVAYLEDGTMIVVEQGRGLVGRTIEVVVTSAIQTAAGKMFFAKPAS